MVRITSTKLSGVDPPRWRPYPGISLLYDPPGCAALAGLEPLAGLPTARQREPGLYERLWGAARELAAAADAAGLALAPLPPATYHVTLCDGVNRGVLDRVHPEHREELAATLAALPDSLLWTGPVTRLLGDPEVRWRVWRDPVTLRAEGVAVRGHALVAALVPAGQRSRAALARHATARDELVERLAARLGVEVPQPWRPHVTLGYFANEDDAARARHTLIPGWQDTVRARTARAAVTFRSAAVHGFTDMASFWRLGH